MGSYTRHRRITTFQVVCSKAESRSGITEEVLPELRCECEKVLVKETALLAESTRGRWMVEGLRSQTLCLVQILTMPRQAVRLGQVSYLSWHPGSF